MYEMPAAPPGMDRCPEELVMDGWMEDAGPYLQLPSDDPPADDSDGE